jgi:hypothetical protein
VGERRGEWSTGHEPVTIGAGEDVWGPRGSGGRVAWIG